MTSPLINFPTNLRRIKLEILDIISPGFIVLKILNTDSREGESEKNAGEISADTGVSVRFSGRIEAPGVPALLGRLAALARLASVRSASRLMPAGLDN